MTKIMFYGTRDYEKNDALNWGKANNVEVVTVVTPSKPLAKSTVSSLKISSVVTTSTLFALPQFNL
jgi:D-lactate dehydrogenase